MCKAHDTSRSYIGDHSSISQLVKVSSGSDKLKKISLKDKKGKITIKIIMREGLRCLKTYKVMSHSNNRTL